MPTNSIKTKSTVVASRHSSGLSRTPTLTGQSPSPTSPWGSSIKSSSIGRPPTVVAPVSRIRSQIMKKTMEPSTTGMSTVEIVEKATATLSALSTRDALTVWKAFGLYVDDQMKRHRVLKVDGFGVFGYNDAREGIFLHHPVFLQSNRLKEAPLKGLKGQPALAVAAEPMSTINAAEIGQEYLQNCGRETVTSVISHVIALIGKVAKQGRTPLRLSFLPMGEWVCADGDSLVEFRFQLKFQDEMRNRPLVETTDKKVKKTDDIVQHAKERVHDEPEKDEGEETGPRSQPLKKGTRTEGASLQNSARTKRSDCMSVSDKSRDSDQLKVRVSGTVRSPTRATSRTAWSDDSQKQPSSSTTSTGIIARVRAKIIERCGENGLNSLSRVLSLLDTSGDGALSPQELKFGLRDLGIELTSTELTQIVQYFDRNGDGVVSLDELLTRMRGGRRSKSLSVRRLALINKAFTLMDPHHRGVVTLDDLRDNYDVSLFPRVRAGKKTKDQAMTEFLREWEVETDRENNRNVGGITRDAFIDYYHNVSACMPQDSDFEMMMRQAWHVSASTSEEEDDDSHDEEEEEPQIQSRPVKQSKKEQVVQPTIKSKGTEEPTEENEDKQWSYLRTQLLVQARAGSHTKPTLDDMSRRLGANRVWGDGNETMNTRAFANALCSLDRHLQSKDAQHLAQLVIATCTGGNDIIALAELYQLLYAPPAKLKALRRANTPSAVVARNGQPQSTAAVSGIIARIRQRLIQRLNSQQDQREGEKPTAATAASSVAASFLGLNALQRSLRLMDTNNDKRLSKDELKLGLMKFGVDINFHELDQLFTALDADRSGCIDADEFLVAMRGEMHARRLAFVHQAFAILDCDGDGCVTLAELSAAYDTSKHPDVIAGRLTAREALRLFAQQWDTGDKDDVITREEFETYYKNVSASIDSDDYFELTMRNAWHISGGEGQCANSSNRRVLVIDKDGSQRVCEVKDDLGIGAKDQDKMRAKLKATYGDIDTEEVHMTGYVDNKTEAKGVPKKVVKNKVVPSRPSTSSSQNSKTSSRSKPNTTRSSEIFPTILHPMESSAALAKRQRQKERDIRERAALCIQANFRGFKCRQFADCVRRQMAAERVRKQREHDEVEATNRKRIIRAPLKANYGF